MGKRSTFEHLPTLIEPDAQGSSSVNPNKRQKRTLENAALALLSFRHLLPEAPTATQVSSISRQEPSRFTVPLKHNFGVTSVSEDESETKSVMFASVVKPKSPGRMKQLLPSLKTRQGRISTKPMIPRPLLAPHLSSTVKPINLSLKK